VEQPNNPHLQLVVMDFEVETCLLRDMLVIRKVVEVEVLAVQA
jgi:hypothetical protein